MAIGAHRKVVTVVFCDVVGSTALGESVDPEALQGLLARYFDRMKGIVESHGGSVEKFIGDAVMAVFGVPVAHEDDALRACRAAVEMRDAFPELGVEGRIGVNTGEMLTGTEERLVTGDAVNVAARLEQAAEPGEVLIGAETLALVGAAVEVGQERLLELKGKSEPVAAFPLVAVREAAERAHVSRFVGRGRELGLLTEAWDKASAGLCCELVTVVGEPGIGKSRLVAEALERIDARVVRGRCPSYGEGITYWPLVEVVRQLDALPSDEFAANAIRSLLGESVAVSGTDDIAWASRKLLEEQAPLVVFLDDIQWGEETFLDLVESTALLSRGAPLLLLCVARPELLDRRPGWPATLRLEPLPEEDADALVGGAVPEKLRQQIVRAAGGNPLFLTEMVALSEEGGKEVEVPATLRALLAARLDQLDEPERRVLERGAIEGEVFHRGTVQALAPEDAEVTPRLAALVRRDLVRPDEARLPREDAYRFSHLLLRDAAYDALPKATRADLHRRFAVWLEEHGQNLVELDEIVGYHLEQAHRYRVELGIGDEETDELARRAVERLGAAGERAMLRQDPPAAVALLERTLALLPPYDRPATLEVFTIRAHQLTGDLAGALARADAYLRDAREAADPLRELRLRVARGAYFAAPDPKELQGMRALGEEAIAVFSERGDDAALVEAWLLIAEAELGDLHWRSVALAVERATKHADLAGGHPFVHQEFGPAARLYGPFPVEEALAWFDENPAGSTLASAMRGHLEAMRGNFELARLLCADSIEQSREQGRRLWAAGQRGMQAEIELLAGDAEAAAEASLLGVEELSELGERGWLARVAGLAAEALYRLGRDDEAWRLTERAEDASPSDDVSNEMLIRQVRAKLLARRGELAEAERLAREAVAWGEPTDSLEAKADTFYDLAIVLVAADKREQAVATLEAARRLYAEKGHTVGVARVEELRADLLATP